jgi:hypothetical protein
MNIVLDEVKHEVASYVGAFHGNLPEEKLW